MEKPLVTIAIALYNNQAYVRRCLASVIGQSYTQLEIIIVDDGSNDESIEEFDELLSDNRIRLFRKENGGLSSARQMALDNANGNYICFIDADDYLDRCYVECLLNKIKADNADVCVCSARFENETGDYLASQSCFYHCTDSEKPYRINIKYLEKENFPLNISITDSWNKMYRMEFLKQCKVFFSMPKGLNGTDTVFNMKLALNDPVYTTCSSELYYHVVYRKSAAHRKNKNLYRSFCILVEQLHIEANRINRLEQTSRYISNVYCSCLRHAMQDVSDETTNKMGEGSLNSLINAHKRFIIENPYVKLSWNTQNSFSAKLFVLILKISPSFLQYYLSIRSRIVHKNK